MKTRNLFTSAKAVLALLLISAGFAACSTSVGIDEDELEPVGLRIYTSSGLGEADSLVVDHNPASIEGSLTVNDQVSNYTVVFIAPDGQEFVPDLAEHSITVTAVQNEQNITISRPTVAVQNMDFGVRGDQGSAAQIQITLLHEGGAEFVSGNIDVNIQLVSAQ